MHDVPPINANQGKINLSNKCTAEPPKTESELSKQLLSNFQAKNSCPVSNVAKEEINKFIRKETKGSQNPRSAKQLSPWDCGQVGITLETKLVIYQK